MALSVCPIATVDPVRSMLIQKLIPKFIPKFIPCVVLCLALSIGLFFPWITNRAIAQTVDETVNETTNETVAVVKVSSKSEIEKIKERGKISIAMVNKDNPPFFSNGPDGKLIGIDVDLGNAIAASLGVQAEFIRSAKTFDEVIETVYRGESDLAISKLARSLPRAQKVLFSSSYLNFRQALLFNRLALAKEQSTGLSTDQVVKDFQGKLGVYAGSVYVQYAHKIFPKATIVEFPQWQEAIDAVVLGQVTVLFRDELEVRSIVLNKPELAIKLRTVVLTDTSDTKGIVASFEKYFLIEYINLFLETQDKKHDTNQLLNASIK